MEIRSSTTDPSFGTAATVIGEQLRAIGLDARPRELSPDSYYLVWGSGDWLLATGAGVGGVDPGPPNTGRWGRFDKATVA